MMNNPVLWFWIGLGCFIFNLVSFLGTGNLLSLGLTALMGWVTWSNWKDWRG